ncbi:hypothetical protein PHMEG_00012707 [Phytophthora megakarya]|uniref:Uncharacterized protein n=1 Tax=Phytophthora megakarya TaxID=4795 RepID=A0A225W815_9STRA|nr:hypothetical protein PHMEG_00012707 [Phytophthora megakarya]
MLMKGDVKGAFKKLMVNAHNVHWMMATLPKKYFLLIDLTAPFGWAGSPSCYSVNDHILVEPQTGPRLECSAAMLRLAMVMVLCPQAINEDKFCGGDQRCLH